MYAVINASHQAIINSINQHEVNEYDWLRHNVGQVNAEYQKRYRYFWGMRDLLGNNFYAAYFTFLMAQPPPTLNDLCHELYNHGGTVQFSFATKLLHMRNPHLPIYDSKVARFFLFKPPSNRLPGTRIARYIQFYNFLQCEYARIINGGLLAPAIAAFRQHFNPMQHTDEKIIGWLIWGLVTCADHDAVLNGHILYQ